MDLIHGYIIHIRIRVNHLTAFHNFNQSLLFSIFFDHWPTCLEFRMLIISFFLAVYVVVLFCAVLNYNKIT